MNTEERLHNLESRAREVVAWIKSGNSIPAPMAVALKGSKMLEDILKLEKALNQ